MVGICIGELKLRGFQCTSEVRYDQLFLKNRT